MTTTTTHRARALLVLAALLLPSATRPAPTLLTEAEAHQLGLEAYEYLYPLISMELTRRVSTNVPAGVKPGLGPMNAFHHFRAYPTAEFREVVRPNFDTLYSVAWLDLTQGPLIVASPDTGGRYFLLPMLDMWSDVFAVPGKRTSGTGAQAWAVVPTGWKGTLPKGVGRIDAPTPYVWVIGRTQTNGPKDYAAVHLVQAGYAVTPLSAWGKKAPTAEAPAPDPAIDMTPPLLQVNSMAADRYFALGAELLAKHPPHATDWSILARLRRIGLQPGRPFELAKAPPSVRAGLERAPAAALAGMKLRAAQFGRAANGWRVNTSGMGVYGSNYGQRASVALVGLGANQADDAVYPLAVADAEGKPLTGEARYVLHFEKAELPPVEAFWSLTMYDAEGFQVANPLERFAIGDRDPLQFNPDGSLDLFIQHASPGPGKESNWLPAPASGLLGVTMRLYAPKPEVLDGRWSPPAVRRIP